MRNGQFLQWRQSAAAHALTQAWLSLCVLYHSLIRASTCAALRECNRDGILLTDSRLAFEEEARRRERYVRRLQDRKLDLRAQRDLLSDHRDYWPAVGLVLAFSPGIAILVGICVSIARWLS